MLVRDAGILSQRGGKVSYNGDKIDSMRPLFDRSLANFYLWLSAVSCDPFQYL